MLKTVSSVANALGALNYKGTWNASTNTPALASGVGTKGDYYVVSVDGATDLDGITNWGVGDWATFNGSVWQRVEGGADGNFVNLDVTGTATFSEDASIHGLTVGRGSGSVSSNTASGLNALYSNTIGGENSASGAYSLYYNTTGNFNSASGFQALFSNIDGSANSASGRYSLYSNTTGSFNTASGNNALFSNTIGSANSASGVNALYSNIDGSNNTASGLSALYSNTTGVNNSASGAYALYSNISGNYNSASGFQALFSNTTASFNSASGVNALFSNTSGSGNSASGFEALRSNTTGSNNSASGAAALYSNISGSSNTASGRDALFSNSIGSSNTASGFQALLSNTSASNNVAFGYQALIANTTGVSNCVIGAGAGTSNVTGSQSTFVGINAGYSATAGGNTFIGSGSGYSVSTGTKNTFVGGGDPVSIYPSGYFITTGSSNTILGNYNGNQGGLDIRTSNNHIVLSDGDGNPRVIVDASGNVGIGVTPSSPAGFDARLQLESANPMLVYKETDQSTKWEVGAWGGNYVVYNGTSERLRIDSDGHTIIPAGVTLGTAAGVYSAAKTLDDYEEGTWTPAFDGPSAVTYTQQSGRYTKVGKGVNVQAVIKWSAFTAGSNVSLGGLPFSVGGTDNWINALDVTYANNTNFTYINEYLSIGTMYFYNGASSHGVTSTNPYGSSGTILINGTFYTS